MRAIEGLAGTGLARWMRGRTERQVEIAFGAGLLVAVVLGFAIGEAFARMHHARATDNLVIDWMALMERMERVHENAAPRFPPGSTLQGIAFNSLGMRGPDVALDKPQDTLRIVFLGDSKLFNAEFDEDDMVAARTADALAPLLPACRFDYMTIAGPAYTMDDLTFLIETDVRAYDPDAYVLLSGSIRDALNLHEDADPAGGYIADYPFAGHYSRLWDKLARAFHLARQARIADQRGPLPRDELDEIAAALEAPAARLAEAVGEVPMLAIGYRGQLRRGQPDEVIAGYTRQIRMETEALGARDIVALNGRLLAALERIAAGHGWVHIDPIAGIAPTDDNFIDSAHFSRRGVDRFSASLAGALAPMLRASGAACAAAAGRPPVPN